MEPNLAIFLTLANQKKELILAATFVGRMEPNEEARGSYIDASCQVWLHFAKQFQRRRFFSFFKVKIISL
jgi:hypothetical protein